MTLADWSTVLGSLLVIAASAYALMAARQTRRPLPTVPGHVGRAPQPVSVLKPLCGAEPHLYDNLATLCRQQYPAAFQIVCGVRDADDPAIVVVRRLQADFPDCDIALAIAPQRHGSNPKVSNLINLLPQARHTWLVLADSDIAVAPDYLARVTAPLSDARVGVVTCLYRGRARAGFWSRLGAQFVDDWFAPSVRVAHAGGSRRFAFGATIALRRDSLDAIGGFAALADRLADDYWLGELTRRQGLHTVLSDAVVDTDVTEANLAELWHHELRWLRTIRSLNPAGFAFTFVTFTWPMLLLGLLLAPMPLLLLVALFGAQARIRLAGNMRAACRAPLRDTLLLAEWAVALFGSRVQWREQSLTVRDRAGSPQDTPSQSASDSLPAQGATSQRTL